MRAERDPMSGKETGAAALGVEERSDETPRAEVGQDRPAPDPEVVAKPTRRQFTAEYRLRILEETDRCTSPGEVGRLLRREGLYTSHLAAWRKARRNGSLQGLTPNKRGAKPAEHNPLSPKVRQLEAKVARLVAGAWCGFGAAREAESFEERCLGHVVLEERALVVVECPTRGLMFGGEHWESVIPGTATLCR